MDQSRNNRDGMGNPAHNHRQNQNQTQNPSLGMGISPGAGMSVDYFQNFSPSSFGTMNMSMNSNIPYSFQQHVQGQQARMNINPSMNSLKINSDLKSSLNIPVNSMSFTPSPSSMTPPIHDGVFSNPTQHQHQIQNPYASMQPQQQHFNQLASLHQHLINPQAMNSSGRNNAFSTNASKMKLGGNTTNSSAFQGNISPGGNPAKTKTEHMHASLNRKLMGSHSNNTSKVSSKATKSSTGVVSEELDGKYGSDNRRKWSTMEDKKLKAAVKKHGEKNWKAIAEEVPGRNHVQCLQRWKKVLRPGLVKGHWTEEEDEQLRKVVKAGFKNWGEVALKIQGRTPKQCRERWSCNLDPSISREKWSPEEDRRLMEAQEKLGNKWSKIGAYLPGRTENAIKTRAKSLARAQLKAWTPAEDKIIIDAKTTLGTSNTRASAWAKIAEMLPNRSKNAVKKRWKELKENNVDSIDKTAYSLKRMNVDDNSNNKEAANSGNKRSKQTPPQPPLGAPALCVPVKEVNVINCKSEQNLIQEQQNVMPHTGDQPNNRTDHMDRQSENISGFLHQNLPSNVNQFYNAQQQALGGQHPMMMHQHLQQGNFVQNNMHVPGTTPPLIPGISNTPSPSQLMVTASLASRFSSLGVSPGFLLPNSSSGGQLSSPIAAAAGSFGQNMNNMSTTPTNFYGMTPPTLSPSFPENK
mmetsp:Transcript_19281/g.24522  ORF Transcript_19281/g.24522 Transcript_19281/m.24522 type:complete len:692 (-) Transcript_19281:399-2474(-)